MPVLKEFYIKDNQLYSLNLRSSGPLFIKTLRIKGNPFERYLDITFFSVFDCNCK